MASKEVEVLDPAASVEKLKKFASERVLNRRHFIAALGVAGAAAGTELVRSGPTALAQQPQPSGYAQTDVLNFLLNVKFLKATLYSFLTQGTDLVPTAANPNVPVLNLGTGGVFNAPAKLTFSGTGSATTQQITDLFNEMYYDELNQLVTLRSLLGSAVLPRATMNLLGTGTTTTTTTTMTQPQAIGYARLLEDLSVSAFAGASIYLTGTNLEYATQALAVNAFHAAAVRLLAIQTGAYYYSGQDLTTTSPTTQSQNSFSASTVVGSTTLYNFAPTNPIVAGSAIVGVGIPAGTVVTAVNPTPVYTGSLTGTSATPNNIITNVAPLTGLAVGQAISGTGVPANSIITAINGSTLTVGAVTGFSSLTPPTPYVNSLTTVTGAGGTGMTPGTYPLVFSGGSPTVSASGTLTVQTATSFIINITSIGQGYTAVPTVTAATGGTPPVLTASVAGLITTTSSTVTLTIGFVAAATKGSASLLYSSPTAGLIPGQIISGTGVPSNGYITQGGINAANGTITMSAVASATSSVAPTGLVTKSSAVITALSSASGILPGLPITGTGIPSGTTVTTVDPAGLTLTMSQAATATSTTVSSSAPTAFLTSGSNTITALSSLSSGLVAGATVTGTGIPSGTTITSVGAINTAVMSNNATATTVPTVKASNVSALLQSGNNILNSVYPISALASGQLITDTQGNIPPGTTITGVTAASFTITLSAPATGATTVTTVATLTGTVVNGYETISSVTPASAFSVLAVGQPISGTNIPSGTIITAFSASAGTITISGFPTAASGPEVVGATLIVTTADSLTASTLQTINISSSVPSEAVTIPTLVTVTPSLATATLSQAATVTGVNTLIIQTSDPMDVQPYDPGSAALAAAGPAAIAGSSPAAYRGFFDTAGASTSSSNNPQGSVFARTFSQVLAVLYGSTAAQTYEGGFFPVGVSGSAINNV